MILPEGKWLFGWKPAYVAGGSVSTTVQEAAYMGLSCVSWKVGSGVYKYPFNNYDLRPLRAAFKDAGILFFGWHYVYGANSPADEARIAEIQIESLDLDDTRSTPSLITRIIPIVRPKNW